MNKEVEVKARITESAKTKNSLVQAGFAEGETVTQDDVIFLQHGRAPTELVKDELVARIRTVNDSIHKLTIKKRTGVIAASIEHETIVENNDECLSILGMLGFNEVVRVNKTRTKYKKDSYVACVDSVEQLGDFVELEQMVDEDTDSVALQTELMQYLVEHVGVKEADRVNSTYDVMMYELQNP